MGNIQSAAPGAISALYTLLTTAGAAQSPQVSVFVGDLGQEEPQNYVLLGTTPTGKHVIENQRFDPAALGSGAVYEDFELWGFVSAYDGQFDPLTAIAAGWSLYESVVMQTYVDYWGGVGSLGGPGSPVLGSSAPASLMEIVPLGATDCSGPLGDGFAGTVEFGFALKARISIQ